MLGTGEDQHLLPLVGFDQVRQQRRLAALVHRMHPLGHRGRRGIARGHRDFHRVVDDALGQVADLLGEGGREQQVLTLRRQHLEDAADIVDEAHVEHAVGFVEHQHLERLERHCLLLVQVEQAPGGGDKNVHAGLQLGDLRVDLDPAEDHGAGQRQVLAVGLDAFADLGRQFAGRGQDQRPHRAAVGALGLGKTLQNRQGEAGGLAGAGLCCGHHVTAVEYGRDGLGLNRGGGVVAFFGHGFQQRGAQAQ